MLRRKYIPFIVSYILFISGYSVLYTVFLRLFVPAAASVSAFVVTAAVSAGILLLLEKSIGISAPPAYQPITVRKEIIRHLRFGFWGLLGINCLLTMLFPPVSDNSLSGESLLITILAAGIVHPIGEEFLFRKLYLPRIEYNIRNAHAAATVQAILFALTHYASGAGNMLYALSGGLILAWVFRCTGKLYISVLLHSAVNLLALFIPYGAVFPTGIVSACILLLSLLYFQIVSKRKEKRS